MYGALGSDIGFLIEVGLKYTGGCFGVPLFMEKPHNSKPRIAQDPVLAIWHNVCLQSLLSYAAGLGNGNLQENTHT